LIGEIDYLGRGFGKQIVDALINEIRLNYNTKRIIVQPEPENLSSCKTLLSSGFNFDINNEIYILEFVIKVK
jgi:RimJ/RimL family protein N-acetyltransferase